MERLTGTELQLTSVGVEVGLEVWDRHTVGVSVVNTQSAAYVDMLHTDAMSVEFVLEFVHAVAEGFEVAHIEDLRTDMEMQTYELHVL